MKFDLEAMETFLSRNHAPACTGRRREGTGARAYIDTRLNYYKLGKA
jgi:hypothetical protein